jgi:hypothetical protein
MRNRIINGGMTIFQRGASVTSSGYFVDRWAYYASQASKGTANQSSTAPAGFVNSSIFTSSSAYSVGSGDYFFLQQWIEGYNIADLGWGTANAKTVTLSFQVYSSLTGTFGGSLKNDAGTRSYPFTYTISSANTWTSISITVVGDTTGTWLTTNGGGIGVQFGLGVGSSFASTAGSWAAGSYFSATGAVSVVGTSGATWYVTGVQLEAGTTASPFEYRQYGTELVLCQRYYQQLYFENIPCYRGNSSSTGAWQSNLPWLVQLRTTPTITFPNYSTGAGGTPTAATGTAIYGVGTNSVRVTGGTISANTIYELAIQANISAEL